ncbi:MAG: GAF domain-containing SpoIIE family protein phosphatase, partial [Fibrobacterota bacterium]
SATALLCMPFLSFVLRENKQTVAKTIATRDREIQIFADITKKLNSTFKLEALLESFVREICEILDAYSAALYIDRKVIKAGRSSEGKISNDLVCEAVHGFYPPVGAVNERAITKLEFLHKIIMSAPVKSGDGVVGRVFETGKAGLLYDLDTNPDFVQTIPKVAVTKTIITMPLSRQGSVYGVLQVVNKNDGDNFHENDFRFAEMIVDQASLAIYNTFLMQERERKLETDMDLKAAQEIQLSLIPKDIPATQTLDIAMHFSPTQQIGGDYYDFIRIDDTHLGVIIADVSGKGVTGGLVMSVMRTIMRMISENNYSPRAVLTELNHGVAIAVKEKHMFITVMYCIFDEAGKTVKVCRGGHNPFLVCKGATGEIQMLKPEGIALGIIDSATFSKLTKEIEVPYQSGDSFYLYTDGVVEEFDKNRQMFGEERLKAYIAKTKDDPSEPVIAGLVKALDIFRGENQEQHDDTAMIRIKAL